MDELEKVIRGLECVICPNRFCGNCMYFVRNENDPDTGWCDRDAIYKDALELLKAQEPKTVKEMLVVGGHLMGKCPRCSKVLTAQDYPVACGFCEQKVKWDG